MPLFKYNLSYILILISILGCSSNSYNINNPEEQIYISKSNINTNLKSAPKKINIFYSGPKSKDFLSGFTLNYFYTKNATKYNPELIFIKIANIVGACEERIKVSRNSYSIIYLKDRDMSFFNSDCITGIEGKSGLIINLSQKKIDVPKNFSYLNIDRKETIKYLLTKAKKEGSLRSMIIDDQGTKDREIIKEIWEDLGGNITSKASLETKSDSQELLSEELLIEQSKIRSRKLSREIGLSLEHEYRRREDIDSFIISADLENSRSLRPALTYNFINSLPVYLIPSWKNGKGLEDKEIDLRNTFIADMPLMLNAQVRPKNLGKIIKSREFAAGYDAFELTILLNSQNKKRYLGMMGKISYQTRVIKITPLIAEVKQDKIEYSYYTN